MVIVIINDIHIHTVTTRIISVQSNLANGHITDLSPVTAANGLVWSWAPSNTWFVGPTSQHAEQHLDRFSRFCTAHPCAQYTDTQRPCYMQHLLQ